MPSTIKSSSRVHEPTKSHPSTQLRATAAAKVADRLFRRAAGHLDVRIEYPDGTLVGVDHDRTILPRMIIRKPDAFMRRVGRDGLIGFGESYMAGEWTSPDLAGVLGVFASRMANLIPRPLQALRGLYVSRHPSQEIGAEQNTRSNISRHYDLSNELFGVFLDPSLSYSAALFDQLPTQEATL